MVLSAALYGSCISISLIIYALIIRYFLFYRHVRRLSRDTDQELRDKGFQYIVVEPLVKHTVKGYESTVTVPRGFACTGVFWTFTEKDAIALEYLCAGSISNRKFVFTKTGIPSARSVSDRLLFDFV